MWEKAFLGIDLYDIMLWFLIYSILGWVVESIYMSICNRRLTNRGFSRVPMCPIYGVGAITVYITLAPYGDNRILVFCLGALLATSIEGITAWVMIKLFGEIWWDYKDKPFNYKGVLCLESTIAWGVYTVVFFGMLHAFIQQLIEEIPLRVGQRMGLFLIIIYLFDFIIMFYKNRKGD